MTVDALQDHKFFGFFDQVLRGIGQVVFQNNPLSGIVILGALLQIGSGNWLVVILSALSVLIATVNIVGGFLVTRRMLAMFQKS